MRQQPPCPECEKLAAVSKQSNKIGDFLDWLMSKGIVLAEWVENEDEDTSDIMPDLLMSSIRGSNGINKILADYYGIDLDKVEQERRALLDWLREKGG